MKGRKATDADIRAWLALYKHADDIDENQACDWNDIALGFLLARGVSNRYISYALLDAMNFGESVAACRIHFNKTKDG